MEGSPSYLLNAAKFDSATQGWEVTEVGIYTRLRNSQWKSGPLSPDPKRLSIIAGVDLETFEKAWVIVGLRFFAGKDGLLSDPEIEELRQERLVFLEKQALNGSKGGRPRKSKPKENPTVTPPHNPNHNPNHNPKESLFTSIHITNNNKGETAFFTIGTEMVQGLPSSRITSDHSMATDNMMMQLFRGLDKQKVLDRLDIEYQGYQFRDEMHLRNSFKSIGEKMMKEAKEAATPRRGYQKQDQQQQPANSGYVFGQKPTGAVNHGR